MALILRLSKGVAVISLSLLYLTNPGAAYDPRLVQRSLDSNSGLFARATNSCPNVEPLEGSKDGVYFKNGASDGCPLINKVNSKGDCMDGFQTHGSISTCSSYCEQQVQFFYGPESVFTQFSQCRANEPCSFTTTDSKTITNSYSFTLTGGLKARSDETGLTRRDEDAADLKPTFNLGATYDYSVSSTIAKGLVLSRPTTEADQCGHWTFVPIMWKSCGAMSTGDFTPELAECDTTSQTFKTDKNMCNNTPYLDSNGNQAGEAIFVLVNCDTNALLPMDKQDPIYQRPGVCATC